MYSSLNKDIYFDHNTAVRNALEIQDSNQNGKGRLIGSHLKVENVHSSVNNRQHAEQLVGNTILVTILLLLQGSKQVKFTGSTYSEKNLAT